jgi:hypothetical protein
VFVDDPPNGIDNARTESVRVLDQIVETILR